MSAPPFMKLYVSDYLADTIHLNAVEHGAYFLLLMAMWRAGGRLSRDEQKLAKIARVTADEWAEIRDTVLGFFTVRGGSITHKRIQKEIDAYHAASCKGQRAGKASQSKRANKNNETKPVLVEPKINQSEPEPETDIIPPKPSVAPAAERVDFDDFWAAYPTKVGKGAARKAFSTAIKKTDLPTMLIAIGEAKRSRQWREGFIPHPATWLNQERWLDGVEDKPAPVATPPPDEQTLNRRVQHWRDTGEWKPAWGEFPKEQAA